MLSPTFNDSAALRSYDAQRAADCADHYASEVRGVSAGVAWIADYIDGAELTRDDVTVSDEWIEACADDDGLTLDSAALDGVRAYLAGWVA